MIPKSASFKSAALNKYNTRVPAEDRPAVPNKSHSKGHQADKQSHYATVSQRHLSFKEPSTPKASGLQSSASNQLA